MHTIKRRKSGLWPVGLWILSAVLSGCDAMAELTFEDERLVEVIPQGLVSADCVQTVKAGTSDAVFRFSVLTSFDEHMSPGTRYSSLGDLLEPGGNFSAKDVSFSSGWFFVAETATEDMKCTEATECPQGAMCMGIEEMGLAAYYYPRADKFCVYPAEVTVKSDPVYEHFRSTAGNQGRTIAFVIDNSATLDGSLKTGVPDNSQATDPWQYRKVGLNQFMDGLAMTRERSPRFEFSAHFANGTGDQGVFESSAPWMRTEAVWKSTVMAKYPQPGGGSPIWEAAIAAIQKIQDNASAAYAHSLVAFTDGSPNEGTDDAFTEFGRLVRTSGRLDINWIDFEPDASPHMRYAEVTSWGCGSYHLIGNAAQIPDTMYAIAINSESHWSVPLAFLASLPDGYLYRLATEFTVNIGTTTLNYVAQRMNNAQNETMDYRLVIAK